MQQEIKLSIDSEVLPHYTQVLLAAPAAGGISIFSQQLMAF